MIHRIEGAASLLLGLMVPAFLLSGGCATPGEKMVESFSHTRKAVAEAEEHVDTTLVSLHALRSTPVPDLTEGFRRYRNAVEQLEQEGVDASRRANALRQQADEHVQSWQREMETLSDPTIKGTMEDRRQAVRTNFKLFTLYLQDARKAYTPYLSGNQQLIKALSIDLSPAAIASLSPSIDRVLLDGDALKEKLAAVQYALNNMAAGISPIGETQ